MTGLDEALAELTVVDGVAPAGLGVHITQIVTAGKPPSWHAQVSIRDMKLDGHAPQDLPDDDPDAGMLVPTGSGPTRGAALADLERVLRRVTAGLVTRPDPARLVWHDQPVYWAGTALLPVPLRRSA